MAKSETLEKSSEQTSPNQEQAAGTAPPMAVPSEPKKKPVKAIGFGIAVLILGAIFGFKTWSFNQTHVSTDNAYVDASIVNLSAQVSGTIDKVLVTDNQFVKKGQLIATIDSRPFQAAYDQAQANLDAAVSAAQNAGINIDLTKQSGNAQVLQAEGVVGQAESGVATAQSDVAKAAAGIASARAGESSATSAIVGAQSQLTNANSALAKAQAGSKAAQAVVDSAIAQVRAADANVQTAQVNQALAAKDAARYAALVGQGAVSQQDADVKLAAAQSLQSALEAARQQASAARANLAQQRANLVVAQQNIVSANAAIRQVRSQIDVAESEASASQAVFQQSLALKSAATQSVQAARQRELQASGQLAQAQTAGTQLTSSESAKKQALARVELAKAQLQQAQLNLNYTKIFAPADGVVTKKNCDIGQLVSPNAPLMAIVDNKSVYVWANYKETQMDGIQVGDPVDVTIDAFPGLELKGKIQSIQAGTGSAFSLIPPDNASGNFTKVVQRIPVKVVFDAGQPHLDELAPGMSANAITIIKG